MREKGFGSAVVAFVLILLGSAVSISALQVAGLAALAARGDVAGCAAGLNRGERVDAVSAGDPLRRTPLMLAAVNGNATVVSLLLAHGARVNALDAHRTTALHYACENGNTDVVELLVDHGASLDRRDRFGDTPLIAATRENHIEAVQILLAAGANPALAAREPAETPAALAHRLGHISIELVLTRVSNGGCFYPEPIPSDGVAGSDLPEPRDGAIAWPVPLKQGR